LADVGTENGTEQLADGRQVTVSYAEGDARQFLRGCSNSTTAKSTSALTSVRVRRS